MVKQRSKVGKVYRQEIFLAFALFLLPFAPLLHLLFEEAAFPVVEIFGLTFDCSPREKQLMAWVLLRYLVVLFYCALAYRFSNLHLKKGIRLIALFFLYEILEFLLHGIVEIREMKSLVAFVFAVIILYSPLSWYSYFKYSTFRKRRIFKDKRNWIVYALTILILFPAIAYKLIPDGVGETMRISFISLKSYGFMDVELFLWVFGFKITLLVLIMLWFILERKWWKYALFSPILVMVHQIRLILKPDEYYFDEYEFLNALPIFGLVILLLMALSKNARDQYRFKVIYHEATQRVEKYLSGKHDQSTKRIKEAQERLDKLKQAEVSDGTTDALLKLKKEVEDRLKRM